MESILTTQTMVTVAVIAVIAVVVGFAVGYVSQLYYQRRKRL